MSKQLLITGANGFVGRALLNATSNYSVLALGRTAPDNRTPFFQAPLGENVDYSQALKGIDVVVHAAARVHVMQDQAADPLAAYREINVAATLNLARQAAAAGVKRFIFISSIKVNGESTPPGKAFLASDTPAPQDAYGQSKAEAEQLLRQLALETAMELVIIRPPLVYGPGVKANFASLMRLASKGLPLPFGAVHNARSLVALDNLVSLICCCIEHPAAANQIFLVSDDEDVSLATLLRLMAKAAGKPARLLPVPPTWFALLAKLTGKQAVIDRLCGNLQLDISHTKKTLGWRPVVSVEQGIKRCFNNEEVC